MSRTPTNPSLLGASKLQEEKTPRTRDALCDLSEASGNACNKRHTVLRALIMNRSEQVSAFPWLKQLIARDSSTNSQTCNAAYFQRHTGSVELGVYSLIDPARQPRSDG